MSSPTPVDWDRYRADWPYLAEGTLWLQHAGITPLNQRVLRAGIERAEAFSRQPATAYPGLWHAATDGARAAVAELIGARPADVALVKNTSQGLIFIAESLAWQAGDNVVTLAGEYPANRLPWRAVERHGVEVRVVSPDEHGRFPVERVAAAIDGNTRVLAVSWVQYINGFRIDLEGLAEVCRAHEAWLVVDGVQGVGALPCPLEAVDALACGGHKWLCGAEGAGFLYLAPRLLERLRPFNVSWHSTAERLDQPGAEVLDEGALPPLKAGAERFEEGTPNALGQVMLGEAAGMLAELGTQAIAERLWALQDHLLALLEPRGYQVVSSRRLGERSGIVAVRHPDHDPEALVSALKRDSIVALHRGNHLRLSAHFYNNPSDMERTAAALP